MLNSSNPIQEDRDPSLREAVDKRVFQLLTLRLEKARRFKGSIKKQVSQAVRVIQVGFAKGLQLQEDREASVFD